MFPNNNHVCVHICFQSLRTRASAPALLDATKDGLWTHRLPRYTPLWRHFGDLFGGRLNTHSRWRPSSFFVSKWHGFCQGGQGSIEEQFSLSAVATFAQGKIESSTERLFKTQLLSSQLLERCPFDPKGFPFHSSLHEQGIPFGPLPCIALITLFPTWKWKASLKMTTVIFGSRSLPLSKRG